MSDGRYMDKNSEWTCGPVEGMFTAPTGTAVRFDGTVKQLVHEANYAFGEGYFSGRASRDNLVEAARGVVREMGCHISPKLYYAIIALEKALIEAKK